MIVYVKKTIVLGDDFKNIFEYRAQRCVMYENKLTNK